MHANQEQMHTSHIEWKEAHYANWRSYDVSYTQNPKNFRKCKQTTAPATTSKQMKQAQKYCVFICRVFCGVQVQELDGKRERERMRAARECWKIFSNKYKSHVKPHLECLHIVCDCNFCVFLAGFCLNLRFEISPKKPSALLLLVGFGSFSRSQPQAHRNKRAYSNSNKWRRAQFMHALFEQTESKYLHCTCNSSTKLRFYSFSSLLYFLSVLFILVAGASAAAADAVVVVR